MDMEEDAEILATRLKHIPSCMSADDIEKLLQDFPVQQPVVVLVRTVQEAIAAGDLPPMDVESLWMQPTFSHKANTFYRNTSVNTVLTLLSCKIQHKGFFTIPT